MFNYIAGFFFLLVLAGQVIIKGHQMHLWKLVAVYSHQDDTQHIVKDADGGLHTVRRLPHDSYDYRKGEKVDVRHRWDGQKVEYYLDGPATSRDMDRGIYMVYTGLVGVVISAVMAWLTGR